MDWEVIGTGGTSAVVRVPANHVFQNDSYRIEGGENEFVVRISTAPGVSQYHYAEYMLQVWARRIPKGLWLDMLVMTTNDETLQELAKRFDSRDTHMLLMSSCFPTLSSGGGTTIHVEWKLKHAFLPMSYPMDSKGKNDIRKYICRYCMQHYVNVSQPELCAYCPLKIFSKDLTAASEALVNLIRQMEYKESHPLECHKWPKFPLKIKSRNTTPTELLAVVPTILQALYESQALDFLLSIQKDNDFPVQCLVDQAEAKCDDIDGIGLERWELWNPPTRCY
eukprot:PhF_6_TR28144/c0_g1_i1/m.41683